MKHASSSITRSAALEHRFVRDGEEQRSFELAFAIARDEDEAQRLFLAWAAERRAACEWTACRCSSDTSLATGEGIALKTTMRFGGAVVSVVCLEE